jgi:hypothetical protein|tara:strand:- start:651 stop:959 length:309 start_codon:yes stop_codon:yes gene_type:complete
MKLIRQISTGRTVYREEPYHEKALVNGSLWTGIDVSDLEVHTQELTEDQYNQLLQDELLPLDKIAQLESTVTPRRIREMTTVAGAKWVDDLEKLIAIERAKL